MYAGDYQRQEKQHQCLPVDAAADFPVGHAYLAQNTKARLVLVALHQLFVVHNQQRAGHKHQRQHNGQEKHAAVHAVIPITLSVDVGIMNVRRFKLAVCFGLLGAFVNLVPNHPHKFIAFAGAGRFRQVKTVVPRHRGSSLICLLLHVANGLHNLLVWHHHPQIRQNFRVGNARMRKFR